jgi:hypothetical protein
MLLLLLLLLHLLAMAVLLLLLLRQRQRHLQPHAAYFLVESVGRYAHARTTCLCPLRLHHQQLWVRPQHP